jgi:regulator of protease activity HflC (stomatin/prohibitin superfamily)
MVEKKVVGPINDETVNTVQGGINFITKLVIGGLIIVLLILIVNNSIVAIGPGQRGILTMFGKPMGIMDEGLNFKVPIVQGVAVMSLKTMKYEAQASAASKDLQDVSASVALNYHLDGTKVLDLYRNVGTNDIIESTIIQPAVQESVKASTAQYNAEQLITERPIVKGIIEDSLRTRLNERGIYVETISITNFEFSQQFTQAIELKQVAQQNALKAERDLQRIKIEADQAKAEAEGIANATLTRAIAEASAIIVQGKALRENQEIISLRSIEKWNGVLPMVNGGNIPFILDIGRLQNSS